MRRIIAFGCSNTYGQALPDCHLMQDGNNIGLLKPSEHAWPSVFANLMRKPCLNLSQPGSSNRQILYAILNYNDYNHKDCVAILWSFVMRDCIISQNNITQLHIREWSGQSTENKPWREYKVKTLDEHDELLRNLHYIDYADLFLKQRVSYVMHYVTEDVFLEHQEPYIGAHIIRNGAKIMRKYPRGLDNAHPGLEGHRALAEIAVEDFNILRKRKIKNEH